MKKRVLSIVLSFCMLLLPLSLTSVAAEGDIFVDGVGYASFSAAIAAADDNDTISVDNYPEITESFTIDKPLTISANTAVLHGRITIAATGVQIEDLIFEGDGTGTAITASPSYETSLTLDGCSISGYEYAVYSGAANGNKLALTVKNSDISGITDKPVYLTNASSATFVRTNFVAPAADTYKAAVDFNLNAVTCSSVLINRCTFTNFGISSDETTGAVLVKALNGAAVTSFVVRDSSFVGTAADIVTGANYDVSTVVAVTQAGTNSGLDKINDCGTPVLPTIDVKLVNGADLHTTPVFDELCTGLEEDGIIIDDAFAVGAVYEITDLGKGYDDWYADFVFSINQEVTAYYYGNYGEWGWLGTTNPITVASGSTRVLQSAGFASMHVKELWDYVGTFYCVFICDRSTVTGNLDVSLDLKCYNPADSTITVDADRTSASVPITLSAVSTLPTAKTELIDGIDFADTPVFDEIADSFDFNPKYAIGAKFVLEDAGLFFDDWFADFILTLNLPVKAKLIGRYSGTYNGQTVLYDWQSLIDDDYSDLPAESLDIMGKSIPVSQLDNIGTFYCAMIIDQTSFNGELNVALDLVIKDPALNRTRSYQPIFTADSEQIFATFTSETPDIASVIKTGADFGSDAVLSTLNVSHDDIFTIGGTLTVNDIGIDYDDWKLGAEVTFAGDESVYAKFFGKAPTESWKSRSGSSFKYYTSSNTLKVLFPSASANIAGLGGGYEYSYAFVVDKNELVAPMAITVQSYLYSADGLLKLAVGERRTVTMRYDMPTSTFTAVKASDFAADTVFSGLPGTYEDGYAIGAVYSLTDCGMGYENYYSDIELKVSGGDISAEVFVNYGNFGWRSLGTLDISNGTPITLINAPQFSKISCLAENNSNIYCAIVTKSTSVLTNSSLSLSSKLYEPVEVSEPQSFTMGAPIKKDVLRRQLDVVTEDTLAKLVFSGDTPETLSNVAMTQGLVPPGAEIAVKDKNGTPVSDGQLVGTGNVIVITNGAVVTEYSVVIYGDINGDGLVDNSDVQLSAEAAVDGVTLDNPNFSAADVYKDGVIDVLDAFNHERHASGHIDDDEFLAGCIE